MECAWRTFTIGGEKSPSGTFQYDADESFAGARAAEGRPAPGDGLTICSKRTARAAGGRGRGSAIRLYSRSVRITASSPIAIAALLIGGPYGGKVAVDSPSAEAFIVVQPACDGSGDCLRDQDYVQPGAAGVSP